MALFAFSVQAALPKPAYPVILIHGLNSDSEVAWGSFRRMLVENGWVYGGATKYDSSKGVGSTVKVWQGDPKDAKDLTSSSGRADFYTVNFSSSFNLSFPNQGYELGRIIKAVVAANQPEKKVILVGHSMGGLAARVYLQNRAYLNFEQVKFNGDVQALITVGTPHQGSMESRKCQVPITSDVSPGLSWATVICIVKHSSSAGATSLIPWSDSLADLNNLVMVNNQVHQVSPIDLPPTVAYTSVVATWTGTKTLSDLVPRQVPDPTNPFGPTKTEYARVYGEEGDGVVTEKSQNLFSLLDPQGGFDHHPQPVAFPPIVPSWCGTQAVLGIRGVVNEVHTCETNWPAVWDKLLRAVLEIADTKLFMPMASTGTVNREKATDGTDQIVIRGSAFHPTKFVQVTCRYGADRTLPVPPDGSIIPDIKPPLLLPAAVGTFDCKIPVDTLRQAGIAVSPGEMPLFYYRVMATLVP